MVRCYRLSLPLDEVKECVKAAKEGHSYERKAAGGGAVSPSDTHADKTGGGTEGQAGAGKAPLAAGGEAGGSRVVSRDLEDLTLSQGSGGKKGVAPAVSAGGGVLAFLRRLSTWQALLLWLAVVVAFLALIPRLASLRRRQRSGMRTE